MSGFVPLSSTLFKASSSMVVSSIATRSKLTSDVLGCGDTTTMVPDCFGCGGTVANGSVIGSDTSRSFGGGRVAVSESGYGCSVTAWLS